MNNPIGLQPVVPTSKPHIWHYTLPLATPVHAHEGVPGGATSLSTRASLQSATTALIPIDNRQLDLFGSQTR
jgi:hypothetical protein